MPPSSKQLRHYRQLLERRLRWHRAMEQRMRTTGCDTATLKKKLAVIQALKDEIAHVWNAITFAENGHHVRARKYAEQPENPADPRKWAGPDPLPKPDGHCRPGDDY